MGPEFDRPGFGRRRRGIGRVVYLCACALAVFAAGCGGGEGSPTDAEKAADAEIVNDVLAGELTTVAAYGRGLPLLHGQALALAAELRGQDQAHVDALVKALRGLGAEVDAEAADPEQPGPRSETDALVLAYEEENAALTQALHATPALNTPGPRALGAALAASHAQHLAVLRQALGTRLAGAVPEAFEPGDLPPPGTPADGPETSK